MLTAAKNQCKVLLLSVKYNIMREMTNRVTFLTNVSFMILNNASFVIQWLLLFQLKENIGGYALSDVMVLWGLVAGTYGFSHVFFQNAYSLPDIIIHGKLDPFLVQPKNVLLSVISSGTNSSAIGDVIYGYLIIMIFRFSLTNLLVFTLLSILGGLILSAFAIIVGSLSFWIVRGEIIAENLTNVVFNFSTYPEGIFKGTVRFIMYTIFPVGFMAYLPLRVMIRLDVVILLTITGFTAFIIALAFLIFYRGLRRYSSSNLMGARI